MTELIILIVGSVFSNQCEYYHPHTIQPETYIIQAQPKMEDIDIKAILLKNEEQNVVLNNKQYLVRKHLANQSPRIINRSGKELHPT